MNQQKYWSIVIVALLKNTSLNRAKKQKLNHWSFQSYIWWFGRDNFPRDTIFSSIKSPICALYQLINFSYVNQRYGWSQKRFHAMCICEIHPILKKHLQISIVDFRVCSVVLKGRQLSNEQWRKQMRDRKKKRKKNKREREEETHRRYVANSNSSHWSKPRL